MLLVTKLLLAPSFVVGASLAARRFGPRVGGLIAGLPVVAGPILLAYALEHGKSFAAGAAVGTLLGLVSLIAFVVVYARLSAHAFWGASMLGGWLAFAVATALFSSVTLPAGAALAICACGLGLGLLLTPRSRRAEDAAAPAAPPAWDLPMRAACSLALVLALTAVAGWLGSRLSGLLAPFPIIATVLATFTHAQHGTGEAQRLLRWLLGGYGAFGLFCFVLAITLRSLGTAAAFGLATAGALVMQGLIIALLRQLPARAGAPRAPLARAGSLPRG
ncbi:MAG TPA: hypothetical protein VHT27_09825 [Solirubrobacteraceae bacterium]|jgi:hypothetical protein|nr:hypothetical protein [Solirubrobacteraceae bacterium]